jgi:hypothetical protein
MTVAYIPSSRPKGPAVLRNCARLHHSPLPSDEDGPRQSPCQRQREARRRWGCAHNSLPMPGKATRGSAVPCARPHRPGADDPRWVDTKRSIAGAKAIQAAAA